MAALPTEVFLHIVTYLEPLDQETLIQTFSYLAPLFTCRQFESTDENGDTILHLQARTRRRGPKIRPDNRKGPSFPSLLTSNPGSCLHPQNHTGATPLMAATRVHNLPLMRPLLERDPGGVTITDKKGATALWHAIFTSNSEGIALLLQQPLIDANHRMSVVHSIWEDEEIEVTPLIWALRGGLGAYEVVAPFLAHSAIDLACVDGNGRNPLMLAVIRGEKDDRVGRILERRRLALATFHPSSRDDPAAQPVPGNFDINAVDRRGEAALQIAAWEGAAESIKLILSQDGVEADIADLLHRAIYHCAIEAILAHGGVDVDHLDQDGRSALSNAATRGDCESARVLLRYGARPDLQDSDGYTPISRAAIMLAALFPPAVRAVAAHNPRFCRGVGARGSRARSVPPAHGPIPAAARVRPAHGGSPGGPSRRRAPQSPPQRPRPADASPNHHRSALVRPAHRPIIIAAPLSGRRITQSPSLRPCPAGPDALPDSLSIPVL